MPPPDQLNNLLARYLDLRSRGESVAIEELCRDAPELVADLRREIASVDASGPPKEHLQDPESTVTPGKQSSGPVVGGYQLLREIGRGGMGAVFRARQVSLNRLVALKLVPASAFPSPEGRARFQAEAVAVAQLRHPNIVQIFEYCPQGDELYFSMEL